MMNSPTICYFWRASPRRERLMRMTAGSGWEERRAKAMECYGLTGARSTFTPSPCTGGTGTGTWSEHAYGEAVDLNPVENPYVGCGQTRDPSSRPYFNRARLRPGMVTPAVVQAFRTIGWGWGGSWAGSTKDYMHFSATGH
jgi:D-alanyl-D-alanine carboxypeptidase